MTPIRTVHLENSLLCLTHTLAVELDFAPCSVYGYAYLLPRDQERTKSPRCSGEWLDLLRLLLLLKTGGRIVPDSHEMGRERPRAGRKGQALRTEKWKRNVGLLSIVPKSIRNQIPGSVPAGPTDLPLASTVFGQNRRRDAPCLLLPSNLFSSHNLQNQPLSYPRSPGPANTTFWT